MRIVGVVLIDASWSLQMQLTSTPMRNVISNGVEWNWWIERRIALNRAPNDVECSRMGAGGTANPLKHRWMHTSNKFVEFLLMKQMC